MASNGASDPSGVIATNSIGEITGDDLSKLPSEGVHFVADANNTNNNNNTTNSATEKETETEPDITTLNLQPSTLLLHADDKLNTLLADVSPPIHVSTTYRYPSNHSALIPFDERINQGLPIRDLTENIYSRDSTSSSTRFETILSALLKGPTLTYSSGLAAFNAILVHLRPRRIAIGEGYHGSHGVLSIYSRLTGATVLPLDCDPEELGEGDLIWLETPVNPHGTAFDIGHYAGRAHGRGAYLGVDSTFAPPPLQDPFRHGADVVMHSGTKYIGGHSDLLCGVVVLRRGLVGVPKARSNDIKHETEPHGIRSGEQEQKSEEGKKKDVVKEVSWFDQMTLDRLHLGSIPGSLETWLGVRSLRTLELRVKRQSNSTTTIVSTLHSALTNETVGTGLSQLDVEIIRKTVSKINHASLQFDPEPHITTFPSGRQRKTQKLPGWLETQMPHGHGPVFSIETTTEHVAKRLPGKLRLFHHATSLGGVESLIEWRRMTDNTVARNVLRVSIGVEDERDLLEDLIGGFSALVEELGL